MNTQETFKKGEFVMVWDGTSQWVKRKILYVEKAFNGDECYIVRIHRDQGRVYKDEVKKLK